MYLLANSRGRFFISPRSFASTEFDTAAFEEFLESGYLLGLASGDTYVVGWGPAGWQSEPEAGALYAPDFYLESSRPWRKFSRWSVVDRRFFTSLVLSKFAHEVNRQLATLSQGFRWVEPDLGSFSRQIEAIREGFRKRGLAKAVPIVHAEAEESLTKSRVLTFLAKLVELPQPLIASGFWSTSDSEALFGATPEILFSSKSGAVETMALAGTRAKRSSADAEALLHDPKERHEHQLVVDDIRRVLAQLGSVLIGETEALELPTLYHLHTPIRLEPQASTKFGDLVRALHPTPALGVSPRTLGFAEMRRWDDVKRRGRYGAPFGVQLSAQGEGECVVAIRNVRWQDGRVFLSSGCGVVPASVVEREWNELSLKRESVKRVLGV